MLAERSLVVFVASLVSCCTGCVLADLAACTGTIVVLGRGSGAPSGRLHCLQHTAIRIQQHSVLLCRHQVASACIHEHRIPLICTTTGGLLGMCCCSCFVCFGWVSLQFVTHCVAVCAVWAGSGRGGSVAVVYRVGFKVWRVYAVFAAMCLI